MAGSQGIFELASAAAVFPANPPCHLPCLKQLFAGQEPFTTYRLRLDGGNHFRVAVTDVHHGDTAYKLLPELVLPQFLPLPPRASAGSFYL